MKHKRLLVVYYILMVGLGVLYWRISRPTPPRQASPENFPKRPLLIDQGSGDEGIPKPRVKKARHENLAECKRCAEIVSVCSKPLQDWFFAEREKDYTLHASHGYRGFEAQQESLVNGTSKAAFGWSPHNYFPSRALDVFFIQENGAGSWDVARFTEIASRAPKTFTWGGNWESLKDYPHFEEIQWTNLVENFPNGNPPPPDLIVSDVVQQQPQAKRKTNSQARHENISECKRCEQIVSTCSETLQQWFQAERATNHTLHASHGYRGKEAHKALIAEGSTAAPFGETPHNYSPSPALDVFFIINGTGVWDTVRFTELANRAPTNLVWGGADQGVKDYAHFEENGWTNVVQNFPHGN